MEKDKVKETVYGWFGPTSKEKTSQKAERNMRSRIGTGMGNESVDYFNKYKSIKKKNSSIEPAMFNNKTTTIEDSYSGKGALYGAGIGAGIGAIGGAAMGAYNKYSAPKSMLAYKLKYKKAREEAIKAVGKSMVDKVTKTDDIYPEHTGNLKGSKLAILIKYMDAKRDFNATKGANKDSYKTNIKKGALVGTAMAAPMGAVTGAGLYSEEDQYSLTNTQGSALVGAVLGAGAAGIYSANFISKLESSNYRNEEVIRSTEMELLRSLGSSKFRAWKNQTLDPESLTNAQSRLSILNKIAKSKSGELKTQLEGTEGGVWKSALMGAVGGAAGGYIGSKSQDNYSNEDQYDGGAGGGGTSAGSPGGGSIGAMGGHTNKGLTELEPNHDEKVRNFLKGKVTSDKVFSSKPFWTKGRAASIGLGTGGYLAGGVIGDKLFWKTKWGKEMISLSKKRTLNPEEKKRFLRLHVMAQDAKALGNWSGLAIGSSIGGAIRKYIDSDKTYATKDTKRKMKSYIKKGEDSFNNLHKETLVERNKAVNYLRGASKKVGKNKSFKTASSFLEKKIAELNAPDHQYSYDDMYATRTAELEAAGMINSNKGGGKNLIQGRKNAENIERQKGSMRLGRNYRTDKAFKSAENSDNNKSDKWKNTGDTLGTKSKEERLAAFKEKKTKEYGKQQINGGKSVEQVRDETLKKEKAKRRREGKKYIANRKIQDAKPKTKTVVETPKSKSKFSVKGTMDKFKKSDTTRTVGGAVAGGAVGYGAGALATRGTNKKVAAIEAKGNLQTAEDVAKKDKLQKKARNIKLATSAAGALAGGILGNKSKNGFLKK